QVVEPPSIKHDDAPIDVKTVDHYVRVCAIRLPGTIARDDGAVVVDCRFRPKSAYHPCGLHVVGKRCMPRTVGFVYKRASHPLSLQLQHRSVLFGPVTRQPEVNFPIADNPLRMSIFRCWTWSWEGESHNR